MTETELKRKTWIDKAIDKRITQKAVAGSLGISERQVRRLISRYRERGDIGLVSGSRGKPRNRRLKEEVAEKIKQFINQPMMTGFKPTLMREKLEEVSGIRVMISASHSQQDLEEALYIFDKVGKEVLRR